MAIDQELFSADDARVSTIFDENVGHEQSQLLGFRFAQPNLHPSDHWQENFEIPIQSIKISICVNIHYPVNRWEKSPIWPFHFHPA